LLIASLVGIFIAHVGVVPTRISALGLEFAAPAQRAFLIVSALVLGYLIAAFATYALTDYFIWRKSLYDYQVAVEIESGNWDMEDQQRYDEIHASVARIQWYYDWSSSLARTRILIEFVLPLLIGVYSASALLLKVWRI
jgi:hypothetical protein